MSFFYAYYGGLYNFFSVWILCLFQVVPFIFSYMAAASLIEIGAGSRGEKIKEVVTILAFSLFGFGFFYCALDASTTAFASFLFRFHAVLLQIGGAILFLYAFYFLGILKVSDGLRPFLRILGSLAVGSVMGLAYQPCVTPVLSGILNLLRDPVAFSEGLYYLIFYTLGLVSAIAIVGYGLVMALAVERLKPARPIIIKIAGVVMLVISAIIILRKMSVYKGFLLGG